MIDATDEKWLLGALVEGGNGSRAVRPNPKVGCVVVAAGQLVGAGFHAVCGGPHAEVVALQAAGAAARGATAYVTLEPCAHYGRTGPCVDALVAAGIARVVIGAADPHPQAQGGAAALRAAGIAVEFAGDPAPAIRLAEVFFANQLHQRPWVQLKLAMTMDGRIAAADATSRWITGSAARTQVAALRAQADAVVVGSGTALADNPRLDLRHGSDSAAALPMRVVVDRRGRLATDRGCALHVHDASRQPTVVVTSQNDVDWSRFCQGGAQVIRVVHGDDWLRRALAELLRRGVCHLLCEGGATLAAALVQAQCADQLDLLIAPKLLGAGVPVMASLGIGTLADAHTWQWDDMRRCGDDVWLSARPL
ncbi:MAG: bifunctional diaminohydroxyphosphoribosylaminopyrimidine deaminase/5-amino-6-(5-phosphoribosylamino)uracil reductase RibD [Myxococcales bacterium]|nr:bifunctional diaminohydroxyphosphoribosylaminopyrimidine deaminase/5-amino-6-(5-phosphoribosylamino)uracil reductase RibD [Myxococcales bacterium]